VGRAGQPCSCGTCWSCCGAGGEKHGWRQRRVKEIAETTNGNPRTEWKCRLPGQEVGGGVSPKLQVRRTNSQDTALELTSSRLSRKGDRLGSFVLAGVLLAVKRVFMSTLLSYNYPAGMRSYPGLRTKRQLQAQGANHERGGPDLVPFLGGGSQLKLESREIAMAES
jgi:hypothetical protein